MDLWIYFHYLGLQVLYIHMTAWQRGRAALRRRRRSVLAVPTALPSLRGVGVRGLLVCCCRWRPKGPLSLLNSVSRAGAYPRDDCTPDSLPSAGPPPDATVRCGTQLPFVRGGMASADETERTIRWLQLSQLFRSSCHPLTNAASTALAVSLRGGDLHHGKPSLPDWQAQR